MFNITLAVPEIEPIADQRTSGASASYKEDSTATTSGLEHRIFIETRQKYVKVIIGAQTSAGDVLARVVSSPQGRGVRSFFPFIRFFTHSTVAFLPSICFFDHLSLYALLLFSHHLFIVFSLSFQNGQFGSTRWCQACLEVGLEVGMRDLGTNLVLEHASTSS